MTVSENMRSGTSEHRRVPRAIFLLSNPSTVGSFVEEDMPESASAIGYHEISVCLL